MSTVRPPPEAEEFCRVLGARIRSLRRNMSQADLAERAGVSRTTVTQIEAGLQAPSMSTLCAIGNALGLPVATFFAPTKAIAESAPASIADVRRVVREELARMKDES